MPWPTATTFGPSRSIAAMTSSVYVPMSSVVGSAVCDQKWLRRLSAWPSQPRPAKWWRYRSQTHDPPSSPCTNRSGLRRERRSGNHDSTYSPRSTSSISSLRTGRPPGGVRLRRRSEEVRSVIGGRSAALPLVRVEHEAGEGLGIEVGRLLGHDVALRGDLEDRGDRRWLEEEGGV